MHLVTSVPVPQIQEQMVEVIKVFPQEQMSETNRGIDCGCADATDLGTDR